MIIAIAISMCKCTSYVYALHQFFFSLLLPGILIYIWKNIQFKLIHERSSHILNTKWFFVIHFLCTVNCIHKAYTYMCFKWFVVIDICWPKCFASIESMQSSISKLIDSIEWNESRSQQENRMIHLFGLEMWLSF